MFCDKLANRAARHKCFIYIRAYTKKADDIVQALTDILSSTGFEADLIKTNTDGYDLKVIRGGEPYIE